MNLSQIKRNKLKVFLEEVKSEKPDDDDWIRKINELENELNSKKYGLVWEEHEEAVDVKMRTHIPVFTEVKEREIKQDSGADYNFLLEGDNLHSLRLLEKTHKERIDIIYIDPPYNTGNKDFTYDDAFIDESDSYRHSKWLSFMEKRLRIAKKLLKSDGIIFLSIDRNEGFQLKLLLDEIFGESAFVADLHVETSAIAGPRRFAAVNGSVVKTTEFVLGYSNGTKTKIMKTPTYDFISYPAFDTHYSLFWDQKRKCFVKFVDIIKNEVEISSYFEKLNLRITLPNFGKVIGVNDEIKKWLYSKEISENLFREGDEDDNEKIPSEYFQNVSNECLLEFENSFYKINEDKTVNLLFRYADRIGQCDDYYSSFGERSIRGNLWKGFSADGGNLAKEGGVSFKNGKKPKRLIEQLLKSVTTEEQKDELLVLDFFAGSGTTAEAVLELNRIDNGNRKFILCTNNQNNICEEITYKRITNVINGYGKNPATPANLKYFKTDFVARDSESLSDDLLEHIQEMVELENACKVDGKEIIMLLSDDDADDLEKCWGEKKNYLRVLYVSKNVLFSTKQKKLFKNVEQHIIPDRYFDFELKEEGETW